MMSELGNRRIDDDDEDDDVGWEEDLDFLVKPDEEAASAKDERHAEATGEAAGGLAEGEGLAEGATAPVAVSDQAEQGGLAVAATDDINKGPEPQVFDDVNEPEANNADGTEKATVRDGNTDGSDVESLEEIKVEASSASDNKEGGGIDEGLKEIIDIDARNTRNPISMILEEDIESATKGAEEVPDVEGHRRVPQPPPPFAASLDLLCLNARPLSTASRALSTTALSSPLSTAHHRTCWLRSTYPMRCLIARPLSTASLALSTAASSPIALAPHPSR
ncbi:unnamed protein product [Closterium sp. Naga37s-1]|nr:unnamed protein product [Closterium sp. Naga37s-1]